MANLFDELGNLIPEDKLPATRAAQVATQAAPIEGQATRIAGLLGGPATADVAGTAGAAGSGILGRIGGAVFGPVGTGIQAAIMPGDLGNGELSPDQRAAQSVANPSANQWAQGAAQNVLDRARNPNPIATMASNAMAARQAPNPDVAGVAQNSPDQMPSPVEKARATLEAGAFNKLQDNTLSRPEAAKAVVEADIQRTGADLSKGEKATRIKEETTAMRNMDNSSLSKYLSWALVGAGLLASAFDKSGKAGDAFAGSFNAQLDRAQQMALYQAQAKAKAEAQAAANALKERQIANSEKATEQTGNYQQGMLGLGAQRNDLASAAEGRKAAGQAARLDLQARGLGLQQQTLDSLNQYRQDQLEIARGKLKVLQDKAAGATGPKGYTLSTKDAGGLLSATAKAQGVTLDPAVQAQAAEQLKFIAKNYPGELARDPTGTVNKVFSKYSKTSQPSLINRATLGLLGNPSVESYTLPQ